MRTTTTRPDTTDSSLMSNRERGEAIRRRRLALGIDTGRQFAEATGRDRQTLTRAESGEASETTLDWLEAWLDREEAENGHTAEESEPPAQPVKIELYGVYGIDQIIATGSPDEVVDAVSKLMERLRARDDED